MRWQAFFLALGLLTRFPLPQRVFHLAYHPQDHHYSLLWYPLVGLCIALPLLALGYYLPQVFSEFTCAALMTATWLSTTGALHLDGLIDCSDGFFAAHKPSAEVLKIMKQPTVGAMGSVTASIFILLKCALVYELIVQAAPLAILILACVLPRSLAVIYMQSTPYVSTGGMASQLDQPLAFQTISISALCALVLFSLPLLVCVVLLPFWHIATAVIVSLSVLFFWRRYWQRIIGGYNGDCVGALIEISELATLLSVLLVAALV